MLANPAQFFLSAQQPPAAGGAMEPQLATTQRRIMRKRKPEGPPENNERLSKRLSLLNLEHSGTKLYVPVESQKTQSDIPIHELNASLPTGNPNGINGKTYHHRSRAAAGANADDDSMMQLDDSKYKVYIRNLDDELSSESEAEENGLIFLPDIERHLRKNRIPPAVLARSDPDLLNKQLVLYRVPSSISVPEEQDVVRRAIVEARARLRAKHQNGDGNDPTAPIPASNPEEAMVDDIVDDGLSSALAMPLSTPQQSDDDAMELD